MGPDVHEVVAVAQAHEEEILSLLVLLEGLDGADAAVDPASPRVVVEHHDLRAFLEGEVRRGRVVLPAEVARDVGARDEGPPGQRREPRLVDAVGVPVRGGEAHVEDVVHRLVVGVESRVEAGEIVVVDRVVPDPVEEGDEIGVLLPVDLLELDDLEVLAHKRPGAEEVGALVDGAEDLALVSGDHRGKLVEVADEDHLHASEGRAGTRPVLAEEEVDAVEEIRAEHRDLVDDDGLELPDELRVTRLAPARAHPLRGRVDPEAEEPVHGLAAHVEGGDPGRGEDHRVPARGRAEMLEQGRLPRSRLAGDEEVPFPGLHQLEGAAELRVDLDRPRGGAAPLLHFRLPLRSSGEPAARRPLQSGWPRNASSTGIRKPFASRLVSFASAATAISSANISSVMPFALAPAV